MRRNGLILAVAALGATMAVGVALAIARGLPGWGPLAFGLFILAGVAFERWRYKPLETEPPAGFRPTAERFLDPTTKTPVTVYVHPATGERRYVRG